jgi:hypothetical protein
VARHRWLYAALIAVPLLALPRQAEADNWHGGGGWHGGSSWHGGGWGGWHGNCCCCNRFFFGFGFPAPVYPAVPYYYPPYPAYAPPPTVYAPSLYGTPSYGPPMSNGCRQYTAPISVNGQIVQSYGTACPQPDGSWRIVK